MNTVECGELYIDEQFGPILTEEEGRRFMPVLRSFMESYLQHRDEMPVEDWLPMELGKSFPEKEPVEINEMSRDIIRALHITEEKKSSLETAVSQGRSKESWFAEEMKEATSAMSMGDTVEYLKQMDEALENANEALHGTIETEAKVLNMNPCLDGYIAEQYHAQTFNLNAEATGSPYRAKVLEPEGKAYAKNSVDIVIVDGSGKTVRRYQSKYGKDAKATQNLFQRGDYRGQRKLVPEGQEMEVTGSVNVIEAPDGTMSNPLSKQSAMELRDEAQSGRWNDLNWNAYKTKDVAIVIAKQATYAGLQGAAIGVGFEVAKKVCEGEPVDGEELVETALVTGSDFGVKAAATGALQVGAEKGIIIGIPKGTPAGQLANIAFVAVENAKVIGKMVNGEYTVQEGVEKLEETTVSTAAGLAAGAKGTAIGAALGTVLGPVGSAIGGFIGGAVGYMAGSKVGETIVKGARAVGEAVREIGHAVVSGVGRVVEGIGNVLSGIFSIF